MASFWHDQLPKLPPTSSALLWFCLGLIHKVGAEPVIIRVRLLLDLLHEAALKIGPVVKMIELVGDGHTILGQFMELGVSPDEPSGAYAVPSGTGERMPVQHPDQDWLVTRLALDDALPDRRAPRNFLPCHFGGVRAHLVA